MPNFFRPLLFATVFTTGAAVLIFEVTAVRALSSFFGSSIYVVSSVLTVILAALSLGYYFGGRLADRFPDVRLLYFVIASAGLLMNVLYIMSLGVFPLAGASLPITYGPLILSLCFFFVPAFLLGIDSPFVIKLLTKKGDDDHNGAVVGSTFFWSTVGSIVGSLASGFLLIPFLGVKMTFAGTATILSVMACLSFIALYPYTKTRPIKITLQAILMVTAVSVLVAAFILKVDVATLRQGSLLKLYDGYYTQIEVREIWLSPTQTIRSLNREINNSSAMMLGSTEFLFVYTQFSRAYRALRSETEDYLVVGGGAYTIPRTLLAEDEHLHVDVVEIEPSLFELAKEYFELPDSDRLTNYPVDARYFMHTQEKEYDTIFLDVFQSGHFIPPHLTTKEFFYDVYDRMAEDGVLIINMIGEAGDPEKNFSGSLIKTIHSVFPEMSVYFATHNREGIVNFIVIARKEGYDTKLPVNFILKMRNDTILPATSLKVPLSEFYLEDQQILTDDLSPVEYYIAKQAIKHAH